MDIELKVGDKVCLTVDSSDTGRITKIRENNPFGYNFCIAFDKASVPIWVARKEIKSLILAD